MAKRLKLSGITCLVGKISRFNFYLRVHWLSEQLEPKNGWFGSDDFPLPVVYSQVNQPFIFRLCKAFQG